MNRPNITLANIKKHHAYDLYIGRENKYLNLPGSKWGNPFKVRQLAGGLDEALRLYHTHIRYHTILWDALYELDGLTLGCYCVEEPTQLYFPARCHGQLLVQARVEQMVGRSRLYWTLTPQEQWDEDKALGLLDWKGD